VLDWYGLRFAEGTGAERWKLEKRTDATEAQKAAFNAWLEP
jgi:hypothetical protein